MRLTSPRGAAHGNFYSCLQAHGPDGSVANASRDHDSTLTRWSTLRILWLASTGAPLPGLLWASYCSSGYAVHIHIDRVCPLDDKQPAGLALSVILSASRYHPDTRRSSQSPLVFYRVSSPAGCGMCSPFPHLGHVELGMNMYVGFFPASSSPPSHLT